MSTSKYIREAQLSSVNGVELYRRRFYFPREVLDLIDFTAQKLNMTPSEYVSQLTLNAAAERSN